MNNYPIVDAVLQQFDTTSSNNGATTKALLGVTGGHVVLRSVQAGYNAAAGVGRLRIQDGGTFIFNQPVFGDGRNHDFGKFPIVSSLGASLIVSLVAGGVGIKGHLHGVYQ